MTNKLASVMNAIGARRDIPGDLTASARVMFESNWLPVPDEAAGLTVERLTLKQSAIGFLSHALRDDAPDGILFAGDQRLPVIYRSSDRGESWDALRLQDSARKPIERHFLTRSGRHVVQTRAAGETLVLDAQGGVVARPTIGRLFWLGAWSIDESASGVLMLGQIGSRGLWSAGQPQVWRSADDGATWTETPVRPAKAGFGADRGFAGFRVCQADPFIAGRWYVASDEGDNQGAFWASNDDGVTWAPLEPKADGDIAGLLRLSSLKITPTHLVWIADTAGGPAVVRLDKATLALKAEAALGGGQSVRLIPVDNRHSMALLGSNNRTDGVTAALIKDDGRSLGTVKPGSAPTSDLTSDPLTSKHAANGTFYTGLDAAPIYPGRNGILRWRIGVDLIGSVTKTAAPFAVVGGHTVNWFPKNLELRDDDLIAFFHPQRTAGMSIRATFIERYGANVVMSPKTTDAYRNWEELSASDLARFHVYCGHVNFIIKTLNGRRCLPIGMVRNPGDRLVSLFRYIRGRTTHKLHKLANEHDLATFYQRAAKIMPDYVMNLQTRRLSGTTNADLAIEFICKRYLGVGTAQFMNPFITELSRVLGWPVPEEVVHRNKAQTPMDFEITEDFHAWVREYNAEDQKLFDFVTTAWRQRS